MAVNPWLLISLSGGAVALVKASGSLLVGELVLPKKTRRVLALSVPATFGALIATQVFADGHSLGLDARFAGALIAVLAVWMRAPLVLVLGSAALVTACLRYIFG